jgi:O-antigen/teichoic acid export membrane protein
MKSAWAALNRNGGRELLVDTLTYGIAKGIPGLFGLLSVVVFLRLTGAAAYGRFALISAIVNLWVPFSGGWLSQGILRFGGNWRSNPMAAHRPLRRGLILACSVFILGGLLHLAVAENLSATSAFAVSLGVLSIIQATQLAELQAHLLARRILAAEMLRSVGCFALAALLAFLMRNGTAALLFGTALGYALSVVHIRGIKRPKSGIAGSAEEVPQLRELWSFGWPLSVWLAGQFALPLIDRSMMAAQLGLAETGKFAALSDILTRCFSLAIFPITQAVYPRMAQMMDGGQPAAAAGLLRRASLLLFALGAIAVPALYFMRGLVVRFSLSTFDPHYSSMVLPLAAGGVIWQAALLAHKPLEMVGRTRAMLVAMILTVGLKAGMTFWLLPLWGAQGAAYATLLAGSCYCLICTGLTRSSQP